MIGGESSNGDVTSYGNNSNQNCERSSNSGDQNDDTNEAGCGKLVFYFIHFFVYD